MFLKYHQQKEFETITKESWKQVKGVLALVKPQRGRADFNGTISLIHNQTLVDFMDNGYIFSGGCIL